VKPASSIRKAAEATRWTRPDGSRVPLELLGFPELVAAHQLLVSGAADAEDTRLLLAAIERELELRWRRKTERARAGGEGPDEAGPSQAA
jgi:hypothetical protein